jgi:hypothetical protein
VPGHKSHEPAIDDDGLIRLSPDEDIILGYNNAHPGYQHWLTQCLPAFDWSLRQQRTRPVRLLMPALQPWQQDFLRISAGEITDEPPPRKLSAMEFLAQNRATIPANPRPAPIRRPSGFGGFLRAAFRRVLSRRP